MNRRRKLHAGGKVFPCIEIRYGDRRRLGNRRAVCIACYVTLPKRYKMVLLAYGNPHTFAQQHFDKIVYSFLLLPAGSEAQGTAVVEHLLGCKGELQLRR